MSFRKLRLLNTSGETAPPFACAEVADAVPVTDAVVSGTADADSVLEIRKPTGSGRVCAVGPAGIADDRYGKGFTGDCFVRFSGADPSPGDTLYATAGSWELSSSGGGTGVVVAGDVRTMGAGESAYKICRVEIGSGGSGGAAVRTGRVSTATAATFSNSGDVLTAFGELEVWETILPADVAVFSEATSYSSGNFANLTAAAYDEAETYNSGDWAVESGSVYEANTTTTGTFNASHWDLMDTQGIKRANTSVAAGEYDGAEWDDIPSTAPELIDRNQATVTVEHRFHTVPPEGALVEWDSQGVRILTCDAPGSWA